MYRAIDARRSVRKLYTEALVTRGDLGVEEAEQFLEGFRNRLQQAFDETRGPSNPPKIEWKRPAPLSPVAIPTRVARGALDRVLGALVSLPPAFDLPPKLAKWHEAA